MTWTVNTACKLPIYQQLAQQIRAALARGELQPGVGLPSVRQMSQDLVVNPNTVARAYTELEREGLLVSSPGRGVFVAAPRTDLTPEARDRKLIELLDNLLTEAVHLGYAADEVIHHASQRVRQFHWNGGKAA